MLVFQPFGRGTYYHWKLYRVPAKKEETPKYTHELIYQVFHMDLTRTSFEFIAIFTVAGKASALSLNNFDFNDVDGDFLQNTL